MLRFVHKRFALRPVPLFTVFAVTFAAVLFVAQAAPAAAQTATVTRPAGTAVATGVATRAQGVGTAVATRAATTTATAARPAATGTGGGVAATTVRPPATAVRPAATVARPAATRPANAGAAPVMMPRAGGGGMATSFTDENTGTSRGLWLGLAGLVTVAGGGLFYARRLRRA